jgi:hypothetical protein
MVFTQTIDLFSSYVALNTLNKVVSMDTAAVQRHRNIILDCLRDGDISIRRRALELSYALINEQNVRILIRELLAFLEVADDEFKLGMTTQICLAAERFAPNKRWHIDTVLRVLKLVGLLDHYNLNSPQSYHYRLVTSSAKKFCQPSSGSLHTLPNCKLTQPRNCIVPCVLTSHRNLLL